MQNWQEQEITFEQPVWKCSWSPVGFMLAVSCGNNQTRVFKQDPKTQKWELMSEISEDGQLLQ